MSGIIEARQRLDSQLSENELVLKVSLAPAPFPASLTVRILALALAISAVKGECAHQTQEFALLKSHNTVYKLIGPALVPQDQAEAKTNVEKRLEFIRGEMYVALIVPLPSCYTVVRGGFSS